MRNVGQHLSRLSKSLNGSLASKLGLGLALFAGASWALRRARRYSLRGKNALLTGGSRGLGLEIARVLLQRGANVALVARDADEIARALGTLRAHRPGARVIGVPCDLDDPENIVAMLEEVRADLGPLDVLINNAGTIQVGPLDVMTMADFESAMTLHCYAPLRTMLGVRRDMRARGGGRIANVSSIGGVVSVPHLLPYSASKFALTGLSEGMHAEFARDNIRISTILPGLMRTGSPRNASFKGAHEREYAWFAIADSLPLLSMSAARAARRIVRAIEQGEAHVVLGLPARLAALAHGVFPGAVSRIMTLAIRLLPGTTNRPSARQARFGYQSESALAPSVLTLASERAATRNNER
ncbi:MAG TPA: SDR family oxidoreductase [Polyangiaceae bacterium]|nr:SDR family oxidoreductase [Polyangiaceae bacterium]